MRRPIIKARPQRPYVIVRIALIVVIAAVLLWATYELALRAGLHFH